MIDQYQFGSMTIKGVEYHADLKIIKGKVVANWWRRQGHMVEPADVTDILNNRPQVLVIGKGSPGQMAVHPSLKEMLKESRIELIELPTGQAVNAFNRLYEQGKDVAGAFHLTC